MQSGRIEGHRRPQSKYELNEGLEQRLLDLIFARLSQMLADDGAFTLAGSVYMGSHQKCTAGIAHAFASQVAKLVMEGIVPLLASSGAVASSAERQTAPEPEPGDACTCSRRGEHVAGAPGQSKGASAPGDVGALPPEALFATGAQDTSSPQDNGRESPSGTTSLDQTWLDPHATGSSTEGAAAWHLAREQMPAPLGYPLGSSPPPPARASDVAASQSEAAGGLAGEW